MPDKDRSVIQPEGEEAPGKDSVDAADEIHIPDYTMLDFGFSEGARAGGKLRSRYGGLSKRLAAI